MLNIIPTVCFLIPWMEEEKGYKDKKQTNTLFRVFSFRNGRITVYKAWMYHGWLTKWIPPNRAGKLS